MHRNLKRSRRALQFAGAIRAILAFVVLLASPSAHAADRVYTLVPYEFNDPRFAFSGTITTDGSTGTFSDASFIKDWSITVHTPSEVDGVAEEVFSSATGPSLTFKGWQTIQVTKDSISLIESAGYFSERTSLSLGASGFDATSISWNGAYTVYPEPGLVADLFPGRRFLANVYIFDVGETPEIGTAFLSADPLIVAADGVAVPEPSAIVLTALGAFRLVSIHRRKIT